MAAHQPKPHLASLFEKRDGSFGAVDRTAGPFSTSLCSGDPQRTWKHEPTFGIAREFVDLANRLEVQRSIYVRKECVGTFVANSHRRFIGKLRGEISFFEANKYKVALPAVEKIRGIHHLRRRGAVNEALRVETSGRICSLAEGIFPLVTLNNVQNHRSALHAARFRLRSAALALHSAQVPASRTCTSPSQNVATSIHSLSIRRHSKSKVLRRNSAIFTEPRATQTVSSPQRQRNSTVS